MQTFTLTVSCQDMDHSAADSSGDTCQWYNEYTEYCGDYDDDDFDAREMCCACKLIGKSIRNIFGVPRHLCITALIKNGYLIWLHFT